MAILYSVVIPMLNEAESINELYAQLLTQLEALIENTPHTFQIIVIDDGSTDRTFQLLSEIALIDSRVTVIRFRKRFGKTAALAAGFEAAKGMITVTMDGDLQHDPEDLPRFIAKLEEGYDVVCGWRERRLDNFWFRRVPSRIANRIMRRLSQVQIDDFGGGYKAYRTSVLKTIPLYGGMQRFIPALATMQGARITQLAIRNIPRRYGTSRYGISRVVPVFFDLIRIYFLLRYLQQPLRFFGGMGAALCSFGALTLSILAGDWLLRDPHMVANHGPLLFASGIAILAGVQCGLMGLIGEMLLWLHHDRDRKDYAVEAVVTEAQQRNF